MFNNGIGISSFDGISGTSLRTRGYINVPNDLLENYVIILTKNTDYKNIIITHCDNTAMNAKGYGKHIQDMILNWPADKPITTVSVAVDLVNAFGIEIKDAKKVTNVNVKRLADKGKLIRIQKGIYGNVKDTQFGKLTPSSDDIMATMFLRSDDSRTIGYLVGPTLLNTVGLCTWLPKERHIATNSFRRKMPDDTHIRIYRPTIPVDDDNAPYLQAIEVFNAMEKFPIDAERPGDILREMLRRNNIDNERLIWYARKYYDHRTLLRTIDITLGGLDNESP